MNKTYQHLIEGHVQFCQRSLPAQLALYRQLAQEGQSPKILIVACCDSRIDPFSLTQSSPGDLFVVRNVANFVPAFKAMPERACHGTLAAIQYAVESLEVTELIILGHRHCGGIAALMAQTDFVHDEGSFIQDWLHSLSDVKAQVLAQCCETMDVEARNQYCEQQAIKYSLENCLTYAWISERVASGRLCLHGWYFNVECGQIDSLEPDSGTFSRLVNNLDMG